MRKRITEFKKERPEDIFSELYDTDEEWRFLFDLAVELAALKYTLIEKGVITTVEYDDIKSQVKTPMRDQFVDEISNWVKVDEK